jgi:Kef-type K+ transport system membrane component KefB
MGEFGPILLITLVFSTKGALANAAILLAFVALAVLAGVLAVRSLGRGWNLLERTLETSSQLAIRMAVVIVFALAALASELGLDLLLGGFVAGIITRLALRGHEVEVLEILAAICSTAIYPILGLRLRASAAPRSSESYA